MTLPRFPGVTLSSGNVKNMPVLGLGTSAAPSPTAEAVKKAMEECQTLGLTKSIGVSNFSCKKLADILAFAKIPPAINQVEMNPAWQQEKLMKFCRANGIMIAAYSPLGAAGAIWRTKGVLESEVLIESAKSKGKTVAQVALRWAYDQGIVIVCKSFNKGLYIEGGFKL
ncbi:Aldo/keto reductase/potassium channel subunit beta [Heracleum sosnowskyi]|uniref:Aldo/keto reductase/potassium channel subunit beta n=1 Tax=Heracleum sosnowskyi TaxID=360622 RepID=A0AAD8IBK3_9APIA|nr:Aldo/keto reductase/potassium channel subunit beta [Heracleum sosnowskyi]